MTLPVIMKIRELVNAGAMVVGPKPTGTPSLSDDQNEFKSVVNELWGADNMVKAIGQGKVFGGQNIQQVLQTLQITPDFEYTQSPDNAKLLYVHRKLPEEEIYWVNNRSGQVENIEATFRVTGKAVEIWHAETGKTKQVSYSFEKGKTKVPLHLEPNDAIFVIFKGKGLEKGLIIPETRETELSVIDGGWSVHFPPGLGAPAAISFDKLSTWSSSTDAGIKYFSGTGTYTKTIEVPQDWLVKGENLWLDLGDVKNLAEVFVNGKPLGIVWKKPFRVEISQALKPGKNLLEIKVTDLWVNRLIGDQQLGIANKITYTTMPFYNANSPLLPSGLLGPVRILSEK
jgi:hypothetical protein